MHLISRILFSASCIAALAACGVKEESEPSPAPTGEVVPNPTEQGAAPPTVEPPSVTTQVAPCPAEGGAICAGPLVVRVENLALMGDGRPSSDGSRRLAAQASVVFANRSDGPVRLALAQANPDVSFDNGIRLNVTRSKYISGVFRCESEGSECFQGQADKFQVLAPGDSPASANMTFYGSMDGSLAASLPEVATANVTLQVYTVDLNNVGRSVDLTIRNVPVKNQIAK